MTEIEKYLKAIISLVFQKDEFDQILFDLSMLGDHIGYSSITKGSGDEAEKRKQFITEQLSQIKSDILRDYLLSLIKKNDLWLFDPGHFKIFSEEMNNQSQKAVLFNLTAPIELKSDDIKALAERLSNKAQRKVVIQLVVDESIISGAIIKKDNYILDYSLRTKLNNLGNQWKKTIQKAG